MINFDWLMINGRNPRVHGNGFLQIDLEIDGEVGSERVHIFGHPALPRQKVPTPIHDHRFGFRSTVLRGRMVNVTYALSVQARTPTHDVYVPCPRVGEDTELQFSGVRGALRVSTTEVVVPGDSYVMQSGVLHETLTNEVTITHMRKTTMSALNPRVLCPIGRTPDNDFERGSALSVPDLWLIVEDSFR